MEKSGEICVVAKEVGAQSPPTPGRAATESGLRGPLRDTYRRHFELQYSRNDGPQRFQLVAFAEEVGVMRNSSWQRVLNFLKIRFLTEFHLHKATTLDRVGKVWTSQWTFHHFWAVLFGLLGLLSLKNSELCGLEVGGGRFGGVDLFEMSWVCQSWDRAEFICSDLLESACFYKTPASPKEEKAPTG